MPNNIESSISLIPNSMVDNFLQADISDRSPSHAAVSKALVGKQSVLSSSDEIKEGKENLYFRAERALDAVHDFVVKEIAESVQGFQVKIKDSDTLTEGRKNLFFSPERALNAVRPFIQEQVTEAVTSRQPLIQSSDEIKEGKEHLFYSDHRARAACVSKSIERGRVGHSPCEDAVYQALQDKQSVIKSSDDISEGSKNHYFKKNVVESMISEALGAALDEIYKLTKRCDQLQEKVKSLEPTWADAFAGGNGTLTVVTQVTPFGVRTRSITFKNGALHEISLQSGPKMITSGEEG